MRCLTRYILAEFLQTFLLSLVGMTMLLVLVVLGQEIVRRGLRPENVVSLLPYTLPIALLYAIPATTLFAACSVFGKVAANNEIVAIKSLGISPMTLIWPVLGLAFTLSLLVVGINDLAVTWGRQGVKRVVLESVEQIAYGMLRTHRSYSCAGFSVNVTRVEGRKLIRPTFTFHDRDDGAAVVFTADQAELSADLSRESLRIVLTNWELDAEQQTHLVWPGTQEFHIPLSAAAYKAGASNRPSDIALRNMRRSAREQLAEIDQLEQTLAAEAAYQMMTGDFAGLTASKWGEQHHALRMARERLHRLYTEPWRRWANGFSCFAFVLMGAPVAMRLRNADVWTSFGLCFLPILAIYYPLMQYGVDQAKAGALPPYVVWLGNLTLTILGVAAVKRVLRF